MLPPAHARRFCPPPDAARSRAQQADGDATDDSVINILVASDLHLGYLEKDPIRGDDSFATFNEVFQIANERKVSLARARALEANRSDIFNAGADGRGRWVVGQRPPRSR